MDTVLSVALLVLFLLLGYGAGKLIKAGQTLDKSLSKLLDGLIYLLIFTMGIRLGSDQMLMSNLPTLGLRAGIITLFACAGSVAAATAAAKIFERVQAKHGLHTHSAGNRDHTGQTDGI